MSDITDELGTTISPEISNAKNEVGRPPKRVGRPPKRLTYSFTKVDQTQEKELLSLEKQMLMSFRIADLQALLNFAGIESSGRKLLLLRKAFDLLNDPSNDIIEKVKELYAALQNKMKNACNRLQGPYETKEADSTLQPEDLAPRKMVTRRDAMYSQNTYTPYAAPYTQYSTSKQKQLGNYIIRPDVKFRRLPFYDVLADLLKPSSLVPTNTQRTQEDTFYFHLTPQQAVDIARSRDVRLGVKCEYAKQVQMRFCLLETTCEQEDCFPPELVVKVNNKMCPLPNPIPTKAGVEPKRPPRPVNITQLVKLSPTVTNNITVSWTSDYSRAGYTRGYAISISLVNKLSSMDLLQRLKNKGIKNPDYTRAIIKEKLNDDGDGEIATTSLKVSLICPLGKLRMSTPCRSLTCTHLQCFDASLFLQMNERKSTWNCPVCDKPALFDNLVIDGYFTEVLSAMMHLPHCNEIQVMKDGTWCVQQPGKDLAVEMEKAPSIAVDDCSVEIVVDDDEIVSSNGDKSPNGKSAKRCIVDLTGDSDDDDCPPATKSRAATPDSTSIPSSDSTGTTKTSVSVLSYPLSSTSVINLDSPSPPRSPGDVPAESQPEESQTLLSNMPVSNGSNGSEEPWVVNANSLHCWDVENSNDATADL
ncbi:unnamed protein product [Phyllotreta striolata]|uniref:E3 SUMO-protein ligase PIAS2 n=1 Tax=Phyllotreta striolata TaxID=444603 RepID=A0A9N9TRA5_PHYSR|nr:unnamed protein product [Phyllotreta striolata]